MIDIIGLDLSLTSTGVATTEGLTALAAPDRRRAKGETRTDGDNAERLFWLEERLMQEVRDAKSRCATVLVVMEGYSYGSKGSALFQIGEWGGVVRLDLYKAMVPWVIVTPSQVKKYATGRSGASKEEVISAITHRSGILFTGSGASDKADAWVLRQMGLAWYWAQSLDGFGHYGQEPDGLIKMPASQHAVALGLTWPTI